MGSLEEPVLQLSHSDPDDTSWMSSTNIAGYDFEFDPPLEAKYECPICLMCQRDCVQTSCGHKFCGPCILAWLRREREQCPQDNQPLTENDIYPDNYTRREILQLRVHCPNSKSGCPTLVELANVDRHLTECEYQIVPCPNRCSMRTMKREIADHCQSSCLRRLVNCSLCNEQFQLNQQKSHLTTCPLVALTCESCQTVTPRQEMQHHLAEECPRTVVPCTFHEVGCKERMVRADLPIHLQENTQNHMKLLVASYKNVSGFMSDLGRAVGALTSPLASPSLNRQGSSTSCASEMQRQWSCSSMQDGACATAAPHHRSVSVPSVPVEGARGTSELEQRLQMDFSKWDLGKKSASPEKVIKDICEKHVRLEQRSREHAIQIQNQRTQIKELKEALRRATQAPHEMLGRYCNGTFVWRFHNFAAEIREMTDNNAKVVHSPSFYTSPFGYKLCLRANLYVRDGECYLALFIHMRRGENDDILEWPFSGRFIVSLIDQSDNSLRHNFTEVMLTKPGLEAFERPRDDRNIKGWGFQQFMQLSRVRSHYLRRDTVIIKCVVQVGNGYREEAIPAGR
ncbi:TNF receptor-associated factor 6-like [Amphibalanus amphitrite]|uniref:TNF receptor-associated factor 6-like n=1 Tax=Amphibalanus amphitrite TaxID=1232801 RepID=UPI001C929BB5|nr:TNF receptor-associated factor 6-like [Amphibalanus amphitrite]